MNNTTIIIITATPLQQLENTVFAVFYDAEEANPEINAFQIILKVQDQIPTVLARDPEARGSPRLLPAA